MRNLQFENETSLIKMNDETDNCSAMSTVSWNFPTVVAAVRSHAQTSPDQLAFICEQDTVTYKQLSIRANQVANGLARLGFGENSRIGFLGKNCIEYFEIFLGALAIGAVLVPVNWRLAPPEVSQIIEDASADVLFVDVDFLPVIRADQDAKFRDKKIFVIWGDPSSGEIIYDTWRDQQLDLIIDKAVRPDDVAIQLYTSGTTGLPKGVMLSHQNFRSLCGAEASAWPAWNCWTREDKNLITSPLFHVGGTGWAIRGLFPGASQVILREFSAKKVLDSIQRYGITKLALVPSAMHMLLQLPEAATSDFSSIKHVYYGTAPIPIDLLREAVNVLRCGFVQSYGMTETCSAIAALPPEDHALPETPRMRSAGKPLPGAEIVVTDTSGNVLPVGEVGEIRVRSLSNMLGYWNRPVETAAVMSEDGWLRTGDAGYFDEEGYLYIQDRIKEMIISGGENIYPAEVENAIYGHPVVAEVAVIGIPSEKWGEEVKAIVVLKEGEYLTQGELISWTRNRIGGFKLPKSVDFVQSLPRNPTGKVNKNALRKPYWAGRSREI